MLIIGEIIGISVPSLYPAAEFWTHSETPLWERLHCVTNRSRIRKPGSSVASLDLIHVIFHKSLLTEHQFSQLWSEDVGLKCFEDPFSPVLIIGFLLWRAPPPQSNLFVCDWVVHKFWYVELTSVFLLAPLVASRAAYTLSIILPLLKLSACAHKWHVFMPAILLAFIYKFPSVRDSLKVPFLPRAGDSDPLGYSAKCIIWYAVLYSAMFCNWYLGSKCLINFVLLILTHCIGFSRSYEIPLY